MKRVQHRANVTILGLVLLAMFVSKASAPNKSAKKIVPAAAPKADLVGTRDTALSLLHGSNSGALAKAEPASEVRVAETYGKLPLSFEANRGQTDPQVKFLSRGRGYTLFLTANEAVLALRKGSATSSQPSAISDQPSVFSRQLSAFSGQPSVFSRQLSPFSGQPSVFSRQLSALNYQRSMGRIPLYPGRNSAFINLQSQITNPRSLIRTPESLAPSLQPLVPALSPAPSPQPPAPAVLHMKLVGANPAPKVRGLGQLPGRSNYFIGNDPAKWRTNVPTYAKVKYQDVYRGVDLVYYGNQRQLEYDFVVAPGADPKAIRLTVDGAVGADGVRPPGGTRRVPLRIDAQGDLVVDIGGDELRFHKPIVYQPAPGNQKSKITKRKLVDGRYMLTAENQVGFEVGAYDRTKPLVIDPVLTYSTYLGGSGDDSAFGIAIDPAGNAYVTGGTNSSDFPTANAFQGSCAACGNPLFPDVFVTKLNAAGSALLYSTFLGGSDLDEGRGIAVDSLGNAYVAGTTSSTDFPITAGAFQTVYSGGSDAFVAKLDAAGSSLLYSTFFGGTGRDEALGIEVDTFNKAYVTGVTSSGNFPTTSGAFMTSLGGLTDAFVAKLDTTASGPASLVYATYLGDVLDDRGNSIAVDSSGNVYVAGETNSILFPVTLGAFDTLCGSDGRCDGGASDAFLTKLNPSGSALVYSTFLGGANSEKALAIALDSSDNAYVTGVTRSSDFPVTTGALQTSSAGSFEAFITKLNATGDALIYSTYLGGSGFDQGNSIAVNSAGNAYVAGLTGSTDFPTASPLQRTCASCPVFFDAFVTELDPTGSALVFSTYLGGSRRDEATGVVVDPFGNTFVIGTTSSVDFPIGTTSSIPFPTAANPYQATNRGGNDAFVSEISPLRVVALTPASLDFGNWGVATTSEPRAVTLANGSNLPLIIRRILAAPRSRFAQTNNCRERLPVGGSCTINITFTPTRTGTNKGLLLVIDNAKPRLQLVRLTGTGT